MSKIILSQAAFFICQQKIISLLILRHKCFFHKFETVFHFPQSFMALEVKKFLFKEPSKRSFYEVCPYSLQLKRASPWSLSQIFLSRRVSQTKKGSLPIIPYSSGICKDSLSKFQKFISLGSKWGDLFKTKLSCMMYTLRS